MEKPVKDKDQLNMSVIFPAALLLCFIGGLTGNYREASGEGVGGVEGGEEEMGTRDNCTVKLMSAKMGHRQGHLSLYLYPEFVLFWLI